MSDILELFEVFSRPVEDDVREFIKETIKSKNKDMLWAMKEVAEGMKP